MGLEPGNAGSWTQTVPMIETTADEVRAIWRVVEGWAHLAAERFAEAAESARLAIEWNAAFVDAHAILAAADRLAKALKDVTNRRTIALNTAVLVGWAAVKGEVGLPAWVMFTIIFMWTPPHFWALALKYRDDYAAAGVPMLPVTAGPKAAARQILAYSVVLVGVTLTLCPAAKMGPVYLVAAIVLGARFLQFARQLNRDGSTRAALRLFSYSITYLGLLFAAIAIDAVVQARF